MSTAPTSIQRGAARGGISRTALVIVIVVVIAVAVIGIAWAAGWLTPQQQEQTIAIDGSSTVYPITSAWAGAFNIPGQRQVTVGFSGTGGGFGKLCRGETDLSDASRPIRQSELDLCATNGITGIVEFLIAYDGLSHIVPNSNTFIESLSVADLCRIWTSNTSAGACDGAGPGISRWIELNASWPDQPIQRYGPGTASGTFDYFIEVTLDPTGDAMTSNFIGSEDDNVIISGVANSPFSIGYLGYAYVVENLDVIHPLAIDGGTGPVLPSPTTIRDGTYAPYSRPLFVYGNDRSLARQVVKDFLRFGFSTQGTQLVGDTGYVSLNASEIAAQLAKIPS